MKNNDQYVIDKTYTFGIGTNGGMDKTTFHIQLTPTKAEWYGEYFLNNESDNNEVPMDFDIKDKLDEKEAEGIAQSLYEQYYEENDIDDKDEDEDDEDDEDEDDDEEDDDKDDEDCDEEKEVEDFYDAAYEYIGDNYYYYTWPEDFKKDCIDYYKQHK